MLDQTLTIPSDIHDLPDRDPEVAAILAAVDLRWFAPASV